MPPYVPKPEGDPASIFRLLFYLSGILVFFVLFFLILSGQNGNHGNSLEEDSNTYQSINILNSLGSIYSGFSPSISSNSEKKMQNNIQNVICNLSSTTDPVSGVIIQSSHYEHCNTLYEPEIINDPSTINQCASFSCKLSRRISYYVLELRLELKNILRYLILFLIYTSPYILLALLLALIFSLLFHKKLIRYLINYHINSLHSEIYDISLRLNELKNNSHVHGLSLGIHRLRVSRLSAQLSSAQAEIDGYNALLKRLLKTKVKKLVIKQKIRNNKGK